MVRGERVSNSTKAITADRLPPPPRGRPRIHNRCCCPSARPWATRHSTPHWFNLNLNNNSDGVLHAA